MCIRGKRAKGSFLQVGASISGKPGMAEDKKSLKQLNFQVCASSIAKQNESVLPVAEQCSLIMHIG